MEADNFNIVLICGPWGSGTTSVAEIINSVGIKTDGETLRTNDDRTLNSFESLRFRKIIQSIISESDLKLLTSVDEAAEILKEYKKNLIAENIKNRPFETIFLKYPLASTLLPILSQIFSLKIIYVVRPLKSIEATRLRRGWAPILGQKGAAKIYGSMFNFFINTHHSILMVKYEDLLKNPRQSILEIFSHIDFSSDQIDLNKAIKVVSGR